MRSTATLLLLLLVSSLSIHAQKDIHDPLPTRRGQFHVNPMDAVKSGRSSNTKLAQNFQNVNTPNLPSGWTSLSPEGSFTTGDADDANAGGYFPVPDIAGNIFAMANDDVCNCDMSNIRLISPSFDLSGLSGTDMVLRFNAYHDKNWGGGDATAQISPDGGTTWDTLQILNSNTNWQYYVLDISAYTGNSNVQVKFQWSDDGTWASGLAVDNIVVDELLDNDLRVERVWTSDMKKDLDYTALPLAQLDTMTLGARIKNNGRAQQTNTRAAATISRNGQILHQDSSSSSTLDSMQRSKFWVPSSFSPDSLGYHVVEMEALSDQAEEYPADNVMKDSLRMSCHRFARDRGDYDGHSLGGASYSNGEAIGFQAGNLFEIKADAEATGIRFLLDSASQAGAEVKAMLYKLDTSSNDFDTIASSSAYSVQSSDVSSVSNPVWTDLQFDSSLQLDSGAFYMAALALNDSSSAALELGTSGIAPHQTSYYSEDTASGWTDVNATPMVRLTTPDFEVELPADTLICGDTSLTLDAGSGDSYDWNTGEQTRTIQVSDAGTYSVTVTQGQCQAMDSIKVDTTSSFSVELGNDTTICEDSTITLDAGPGDSYDWSNGKQTRVIDVGGPATYSVEVVKGACEASDSVKVDTVQECATSLKAHEKERNLDLYPNPAQSKLKIQKDPSVRIRSLHILDLQGRMVKEFDQKQRSLGIENLEDGIYMLRVRTLEGVRVKRFVKK